MTKKNNVVKFPTMIKQPAPVDNQPVGDTPLMYRMDYVLLAAVKQGVVEGRVDVYKKLISLCVINEDGDYFIEVPADLTWAVEDTSYQGILNKMNAAETSLSEGSKS